MNNKLILTSYGLTTVIGRKLVGKELKGCDLSNRKIFLFHEPHYSIEAMLVESCLNLGFKQDNIILSGQQASNQEVLECDFYYCTEGNTFEVLSLLRERGLDSVIKEGFKKGNKTYIGCSAGATIAGMSIEEVKDFDRNYVGMVNFTGLGLFDGIIIPHYTKSELKRYISNSPGIEEKYNMILSVSNEKSLVLEV
ncbi:MAG: Type 1 glutamine amidotransferase-like domain-containing protein [Butyrivibrio sp.]